MSLLINSQNNQPIISLRGEIPEATPVPSSQDLISKAILIVQTSIQKRDVQQIGAAFRSLKEEYAGEVLSAGTCRTLIEQIQKTDAFNGHLPTIYRYLILDLQVRVEDLSTYNEEFRIAKAKLAAQQDPSALSEHIQDYAIESQEALVEIAKLAAQQNAWATSNYIHHYGIKSQKALVDIAKIAASRNGLGVSRKIANYGIKSEASLIEICKLAIQHNVGGACLFIQNYGIKSQAALIELARCAAQQDGGKLAENIHRFGIKSEAALAEIALLSLQQNNDLNTLKIINKYNLSDKYRTYLISIIINIKPEIRHNINDYFPKSDPAALLEQYPELRVFGFSSDSELQHLEEMAKIDDPFSEKRRTLYREILEEKDPDLIALKKKSLHVFCSIVNFADGALLGKLIGLFTAANEETNPQVREQKLSLIAALLMHCRVKDVDPKALEEQFFLINDLFALKDPPLRCYLSHTLIEHLTHPVLCAFVKKHRSHNPSANLILSLLVPFIAKIDIPYVELSFTAKKNSVSEKEPEIRYVTFMDRMQELLNHKFFKDKTKVQSLLRNLRTLADTLQLSPVEKTSVLRDLIFVGHPICIQDHFKQDQCERLVRSAEIVSLLLQSNLGSRLMSINSGQLHNQFSQIFASLLKIDVSDDLLFNTFASWRRPGALLTYAGKQSNAETRDKVLPVLQQFVKSVLKNTFSSDRYASTKTSEHWLKVVEELEPAQVETWKKGIVYRDNEYDVVDTDNPCDLLLSGTEVGSCQKVDGSPEQSKCLVAYLVDPKIRMMAVKNKQGVTIARCMIRLLWDKGASKFVLFQEKKYLNGVDASFEKILDHACKKRAQELGLALAIKDADALEGGTITLQAFEGIAPFEYVDALIENPIQTDAGYEIPGCKYI